MVSVSGNITGGNILVTSTGIVSTAGNITGGNISATSHTGSVVSVSGNITGGNISTAGLLSAANQMVINSPSPSAEGGQIVLAWANISGLGGQANSTWNIDVDGSNVLRMFYQNATSATNVVLSLNSTNQNANFSGNVGAAYLFGNGSQLTGISGGGTPTSIVNGTSNVVAAASGNVTVGVAGTPNIAVFATTGVFVTGVVSASGNITGGNVLGGANVNATTHTGTTVSVSANITGGNLLTGGLISATGNVNAGNIITGGGSGGNLTGANVISATTLSSTANVVAGNVTTAGLVSATGNITGNYILGNGSALTGISVSSSKIFNGNSEANIGTAAGNANISISGVSNVAVFTITGLNVTGIVSASGNITSGANIVTGGGTGGNISGANIISGTTLSATANVVAGNLTVTTGTITVGNVVNANGNGVGNIGSSTTYFNTVFAKATSAQYADLAEMYVADQPYASGTVVSFGGDYEVTLSQVENDTRVAGVISTNPSYLMNSTQDGEHVVAVALTGRVPCRVVGTVRKGDLMVTAGNGHAQANNAAQTGTVIGKALQDHDGASGMIEVVVGRV